MRKYALEVYEESEPEYLLYEVNIDVLSSSLELRQIKHIKEALKNNKEIKLMGISSRELKKAELMERK